MAIALTKTVASLRPQQWHGQKIAMPGIYDGIPLDMYHSGDLCIEPSISSSGLRKLYNPCPYVVSSPAHYWINSPYNKEREEEGDDSVFMILGRASHHLLFGEKDFRSVFTVRPATINGETWHSNKTICKAWLKRQAEHGLTVLTMDQLRAIKGISKSLAQEPLVQHGILNGAIEQSWIWKDKATGVWCKARPDASPNDSLDFVDLKITRSVMWNDLQRSIRDYGYYQQAGFVAMACREILGQPINSFSLVFVESRPPYCVEIVTLKDIDLQRGEKACRIGLSMFAKCMRENRWPGPRGERADARYIELAERDGKAIDELMQLEQKNG